MLTKIAHYTEHIPPNVLDSGPLTPYYTIPYLDSSPTTMATPNLFKISLGGKWDIVGEDYVVGGNSFMKVRAAANLTVGQLVAWATPAASTVAAGTTTQVVVWAAGALVADAEVGNLLYVNNSTVGGGGASIKYILANTANTITVSLQDFNIPSRPADQFAYAAAPTVGDVAVIIRPNRVQVCTATLRPCGVALGTATSGNDTIVQTKGLALVSCVGNGTALAVNVPAVPAAAGVAIGSGGAAMSYAEGITILPQMVYAGAGAICPCLVNFQGNC